MCLFLLREIYCIVQIISLPLKFCCLNKIKNKYHLIFKVTQMEKLPWNLM